MGNPRIQLFLGLLFMLLLAPACSKSSRTTVFEDLDTIVSIVVDNNLFLNRQAAVPQAVETMSLRHTGGSGDIEFDLKDSSGALRAEPAQGVLRPGQEVLITVLAVTLVYATAATLVAAFRYANNVRPGHEHVLPLAFQLLPAAAFVMGLVTNFDPVVTALFWTTLLYRAVAIVVQHSTAGSLRSRVPLLTYTEVIAMGVLSIVLTQALIADAFYRNKNSASFAGALFPPGGGEHGFTVHPNLETDLVAGDFYAFHMTMDGSVPVQDTEPSNRHTYAFVLDSDASATNNWVANPSFPNDFWKDTDKWYQLEYSQANGWTLKVSQIGAGNTVTEVASAARAILKEDTVVLLVPKSEIPSAQATWRGTTFVHQGDFGMNPPYSWSGDVEPPVNQPLLPLN